MELWRGKKEKGSVYMHVFACSSFFLLHMVCSIIRLSFLDLLHSVHAEPPTSYMVVDVPGVILGRTASCGLSQRI